MASTPEQLTVRSGRVKHARRLATRAFRAEQREFLAEGPQAVREALAHGGADHRGTVIEVFATSEATDQHDDLVTAARRDEVVWHVVAPDVLDALTDTVAPQGVVARCAMVDRPLKALLDRSPTFLVVCADIRDPGNAGAVIRCADAAGADGVVFTGDSVDPYNPKSVRATVGSLFHLPLVIDRDVEGTLAALQSAGLQVLAADGAGDVDLFDPSLDLAAPTAWLMGNEAWGLPEATRGRADHVVAVPIFGRAESLNLATAAAVCLYTTARSRLS
ncbi:RNA methyltransferase, TrmH family [Aeromicrobium marinum DSM 15272]|uniref:RNA methyltransferase, TrmH family n=1 Tax=Aeromicrobium marinum DSM 15272 TaxID=585531 RepID=E2S9J3_9ACTN|nr:RNA methyltransferase [Aeromicrobium marinum]EFQ83917.1 RNA methyltransferase, TrmH family [Aeromicrobium marinum DSM 15272]